MAAYELDHDEVVICEIEKAKWMEGPSFKRDGSLVLTNKNIIWCRKDILGAVKEVEKTPLNQVKVFENRTQVKTEKMENASYLLLRIFYLDDDVSYRTMNKKQAKYFAREVNRIVTGEDPTVSDIASQILPNAEVVAESIKETIDVFVNKFGTPATGTCSSCGASVNGIKGQVVNCPYCGGNTKL